MKRFFLVCTSLCALMLHLSAVEKPITHRTDAQDDDPKEDSLYLVIDLSEGVKATSYPVSYLPDVPRGGWTAEYKTNKLVLRRIEAGTFMMGSPADELGRFDHQEDLHEVTLTKPYYIGVFEVTQKQWSLIMGNDPSRYKGDARPVEQITYDDIRGAGEGAKWPESAEVDAISFMGKLRAKTALRFDLPTEAQWEYACRAGTSTALNSGKNLTSVDECPNVNEVGRYGYNNGFQGGIVDGKGGYPSNHTTVGSYLPNTWGLYDMHGNVGEWYLDWWDISLGMASVVDPKGAPPLSSFYRRLAVAQSRHYGYRLAYSFRSCQGMGRKPHR